MASVASTRDSASAKAAGFSPRLPILRVIALTAPFLLAFQWPSDHLAVQVLVTAGLAYILFCWTSFFHEAAHQTLHDRPHSLNVLAGRAVGTLLFVPYTAYRETHIRHHAVLNTPGDWELWPYADP